MGITYTENLHLAMQENKSDNLDWDALTDNWKKIDAAFDSVGLKAGALTVNGTFSDSSNAAILQEVE